MKRWEGRGPQRNIGAVIYASESTGLKRRLNKGKGMKETKDLTSKQHIPASHLKRSNKSYVFSGWVTYPKKPKGEGQ